MLLSACGDTESDDSEADGVATFVDSLGERNYLWVVDGKVPVTVVFAESIDKEKADEIMDHIHITAR